MSWPFFKKKQYITNSSSALRNRFHSEFKKFLRNEDNIFICDKNYALLPDEEVWTALRNQLRYYIPEHGDCDDYARKVVDELKGRALKGSFNNAQPAIGFFWTPTHAWIVWVNEFNTVMIADHPNNAKTFNRFTFKEDVLFIIV